MTHFLTLGTGPWAGIEPVSLATVLGWCCCFSWGVVPLLLAQGDHPCPGQQAVKGSELGLTHHMECHVPECQV